MPKDFAELEECTVYCNCGMAFRAKHRINFESRVAEIDRDCPGCGSRFNVWRASYDPETQTLSR